MISILHCRTTCEAGGMPGGCNILATCQQRSGKMRYSEWPQVCAIKYEGTLYFCAP